MRNFLAHAVKILTGLIFLVTLAACSASDEENYISFSQNRIELNVSSSLELDNLIEPNISELGLITWTTSSSTIAQVTNTGRVTGLEAGVVEIAASTDDGSRATIIVEVTEIFPESITIDNDQLTINVDDTIDILFSIQPTNTTNKNVTWSSNNPEIAQVSGDGRLTGLSAGTTEIIVTTDNGLEAIVSVEVLDTFPDSISFDLDQISLLVGETANVTYETQPADASNSWLTWRSSDTDVAFVSDFGVITGVGPGTAEITATTDNGLFATLLVEVIGTFPEMISFNDEQIEIDVNEVLSANLSIQPIDVSNDNITWSSSDTSVAQVNSDGQITGLKAGRAEITATSENGLEAVLVVQVNDTFPTSIVFQNNRFSLIVGSSGEILAVTLPNDVSNNNITWTSSDTSIAQVSNTGRVTAISAGRVVITATTDNGVSESAVIYVRYQVDQNIFYEIEPNNSQSSADFIFDNGTTIYGSNTYLDFDVFAFVLPSNVTLRIAFQPEFSLDLEYYYLALYNVLDELVSIGLENEDIILLEYEVTSAGLYYAEIFYSVDSPFTDGDSWIAYIWWE